MSFSQVYMAKDKATGEVVAIKKIRSLNEVQGVSVVVAFPLAVAPFVDVETSLTYVFVGCSYR